MLRSLFVPLLAALALAAPAFAASPQSAFTLHSFPTVNPPTTLVQDFRASGTLIQARDGSYYGIVTNIYRARQNGAQGTSYYTTGYGGEVYKIAATGEKTTLYTFSSPANNGGLDFYGVRACGPLVQKGDGSFYGTTYFGGDNRAGQVFKITPGGTPTVLHSFDGTDGFFPEAGLTVGTDGNLYGTTTMGGASNNGTIFKVTQSGAFTRLYSFTGGADGTSPKGNLMLGADGNFYGVTGIGGTGYGTIYKITPGGTLTTLRRFSKTDGATPVGGLTLGFDGSYYGTTYAGGANNIGTVYKMTPTGAFTLLHSFNSSADGGSGPRAALARGADGNYYGTTGSSVFVVTPTGTLTGLVAFTGPNGGGVYSGLTLGSNGNFFGTTSSGGANNGGTVFETAQTTSLTRLYDFPSTNGITPVSLLLAKDGNFYGITYSNATGIGDGTVFKFSTAGNVLTNLHRFNYIRPNTDLVQGADGALYGTGSQTGADGFGAGGIWKITTAGVVTTLHNFAGGNDTLHEGSTPLAGLIQAKDGNFYGTTYNNGLYSGGAAFKMTPSGTLTPLHQFVQSEGYAVQAALMQASDGNFYGVAGRGGLAENSGQGGVFKMTPAGVVTVLHKFDQTVEQVQPLAALVEGKDGALYGSTFGIQSYGALFKITKAGVLTTLHNFAYAEGGPCRAPLLLASDGNFYGSMVTNQFTVTGGTGAIFKMTPDGAVTIVHTFTGPDGASAPGNASNAGFNAKLIQAPNGYIYGVADAGGTHTTGTFYNGCGTIFKLDIGVAPRPLAALTLSPVSVYGGQVSAGLVTLSAPAPPGGQAVALASSRTSAATVPSSVTIPAGQTSTTFSVTALPVVAAISVTISASAGGTTKTTTLTVQAAQMKTLTLTPTTIKGGTQNSVGTATLTAPAPIGGTLVTLTSQAPWRATVPASVTILAGKTTATFPVTSKRVTSSGALSITAAAGGITKSAGLTVTP